MLNICICFFATDDTCRAFQAKIRPLSNEKVTLNASHVIYTCILRIIWLYYMYSKGLKGGVRRARLQNKQDVKYFTIRKKNFDRTYIFFKESYSICGTIRTWQL